MVILFIKYIDNGQLTNFENITNINKNLDIIKNRINTNLKNVKKINKKNKIENKIDITNKNKIIKNINNKNKV